MVVVEDGDEGRVEARLEDGVRSERGRRQLHRFGVQPFGCGCAGLWLSVVGDSSDLMHGSSVRVYEENACMHS